MAEIIKSLLDHNKKHPITDTEDYHRGRRGSNFASDKLINIIWEMEEVLNRWEALERQRKNKDLR